MNFEVFTGSDETVVQNATTANMDVKVWTAAPPAGTPNAAQETPQPDAARLAKDDGIRFSGAIVSYDPTPFLLHWDQVKVDPTTIPEKAATGNTRKCRPNRNQPEQLSMQKMAGAKTPRPFSFVSKGTSSTIAELRRPLMPRVIQLILPHLPAQSIPMYPQHLRRPRLIPILPLQHPLDELLLELRYRLFQQYPALHHHSNQRFQLFFHDDTLRMSTRDNRRIKCHAPASATKNCRALCPLQFLLV